MKNNARRSFTPAGRGKSLTPAQIGTAQRLKADGMSIRAIAEAIGSSRATVHRTLAAAPVAEITTDITAAIATDLAAGDAANGPQRLVCPACGAVPDGKVAAARLREELQTDCWSTSPDDPARFEVTHCGRCQPHTVYAVACLACGDGPLLTGGLAELDHDTDPQELPDVVISELTRAGWRRADTPHGSGWICCQPTTKAAAATTAAAAR